MRARIFTRHLIKSVGAVTFVNNKNKNKIRRITLLKYRLQNALRVIYYSTNVKSTMLFKNNGDLSSFILSSILINEHIIFARKLPR